MLRAHPSGGQRSGGETRAIYAEWRSRDERTAPGPRERVIRPEAASPWAVLSTEWCSLPSPLAAALAPKARRPGGAFVIVRKDR